MNIQSKFILVLLGLSIPIIGFATNPSSIASGSTHVDKVVQYLDEQGAVENKIQLSTAKIKSQADIDRYVATTPESESPLAKLTPDAQRRFISSLSFNKSGLTGFEYADLESELTPTEIYKILKLFGVQHTTAFMNGAHIKTKTDHLIMGESPSLRAEDHKGYKCVGRANCYQTMFYICMSGC